MGMGVENAGQHRPASGVVGLGGRLHEIFAQRDDLAARDADIRLDLAHAGDNQGSVANEQIERSRVTGFLFHGRAPCPTDDALSAGLDLNAQSSPTSRQQFLRHRRLRDLAAVLEHVPARPAGGAAPRAPTARRRRPGRRGSPAAIP